MFSSKVCMCLHAHVCAPVCVCVWHTKVSNSGFYEQIKFSKFEEHGQCFPNIKLF